MFSTGCVNVCRVTVCVQYRVCSVCRETVCVQYRVCAVWRSAAFRALLDGAAGGTYSDQWTLNIMWSCFLRTRRQNAELFLQPMYSCHELTD